MQAAMPNGTIQRFLFTPLPAAATTASTTTTTVSTSTSGKHCSVRQEKIFCLGCMGVLWSWRWSLITVNLLEVYYKLRNLFNFCLELYSSSKRFKLVGLTDMSFEINGVLVFMVGSGRGAEASSTGPASAAAGAAAGPAASAAPSAEPERPASAAGPARAPA